jgi:hypothetical protein
MKGTLGKILSPDVAPMESLDKSSSAPPALPATLTRQTQFQTEEAASYAAAAKSLREAAHEYDVHVAGLRLRGDHKAADRDADLARAYRLAAAQLESLES